jgi:hypothetical protein
MQPDHDAWRAPTWGFADLSEMRVPSGRFADGLMDQ